MKLFILSILTVLVSSCASKFEIKNYNMHLFSDDVSFIERNIKCDATYKTDKFDSINDEIFRCSNPLGSVFLEVVSNGNNSEEIKRTSLTWKQWHNDISPKQTEVTARQFAAVISKLYLKDKEIEFVDMFFNDIPAKFSNIIYDVETSTKEQKFYTLRKVVVNFNIHEKD